MLLLRTEDGEAIPVDNTFTTHCKVLWNISTQVSYQYNLNNTPDNPNESDSIMPLSSVQSPILLLLYQFSSELHERKGCACFINDESHENKNRTRAEIEEWIRREARPPSGLTAHCHQWISDFFSILDQQTLIDFINLSNLLDFPEGIELGCKQVALLVRGKTPTEIRTLFNIESDFTDMELAEMREQYQWATSLLLKK